MSYTVKFLDSDSFDKLPYNKIATSVGVADRNAGVAYVRDTGNPMDVFTAYHELEHLKGDDLHEYESPGEDGIYYKNLGQTFQNVLPTLGGFLKGGPIGAGLGAAGSLLGKGGKQPQQQQSTMDSFNPQASAQGPEPQASPATSAVGSQGGGDMGGGLGQGTIDKVRQMMQQRASGFYAGRDASGGF